MPFCWFWHEAAHFWDARLIQVKFMKEVSSFARTDYRIWTIATAKSWNKEKWPFLVELNQINMVMVPLESYVLPFIAILGHCGYVIIDNLSKCSITNSILHWFSMQTKESLSRQPEDKSRLCHQSGCGLHQILISSQCALDVSVISGKLDVHPIIPLW